MKERPILFSGPMVRAILDGRKTQTRRVVKGVDDTYVGVEDGKVWQMDECGDTHDVPCPFGVPGDRLWVRETAIYWTYADGRVGGAEPVVYQDDEEWDGILRESKSTPPYEVDNDHGWWKLRPSNHMPRWACRTVLEVVSVRVERVQEISEKDAVAEGFDAKTCETIFLQAAGRSKPVDPYYVRFEDGTDSEGKLCEQCATRHLVKAKKPGRIACEHGNESDGPFYCKECYRPLLFSPTAYGVERELFLECDDGSNIKDFAATGMDAAIAAMIAGGIGDLREEHLGRLAKIGLATWFDLAYGNGAWKSNPWVWVVEFKRA